MPRKLSPASPVKKEHLTLEKRSVVANSVPKTLKSDCQPAITPESETSTDFGS